MGGGSKSAGSDNTADETDDDVECCSVVHVSLSVSLVSVPWWRVVSIVAVSIAIRMMVGR